MTATLEVVDVQVEINSGWESMLPWDTLGDIIGSTCVDKATEIVPVDTGRLKRSIYFDVDVWASELGVTVLVIAETHYAHYVELGTVKMKAQPYLRPSLDVLAAELRSGGGRAMASGGGGSSARKSAATRSSSSAGSGSRSSQGVQAGGSTRQRSKSDSSGSRSSIMERIEAAQRRIEAERRRRQRR